MTTINDKQDSAKIPGPLCSISEMEASMDRVDRNVCNAHAFVLITNQQHFQSGGELSPWSKKRSSLFVHLWSHQLGGNGRWCWGRPSAWFSHGSSVGGSELWNFWVAERGEEQSQNWCIMEIYEFYLTFTFVYCIHFLQNHCLSLWFQFDMTKWELISWFHYFWLCSWLKDHSVNLCTVQITELSTVCR